MPNPHTPTPPHPHTAPRRGARATARLTLTLAPVLAAVALSGPAHSADARRSLEHYAQPALHDCTATVRIVSKNNKELEKMGKGFVDACRLSGQKLFYKEPDRVRFDGHLGLLEIRRITSGDRKITSVPFLHQRKIDDVGRQPGKADTIADVGVITPSWLRNVEWRWLRSENRDGKTLEVFEFWPKTDRDFRYTAWLDPTTRTIVDVINHHRNRKAPGWKKRLVFSDPRQVNGVWIPQRATLLNGENRVAAVMAYEQIQVNTGLSDNLFRF